MARLIVVLTLLFTSCGSTRAELASSSPTPETCVSVETVAAILRAFSSRPAPIDGEPEDHITQPDR